jgi:ADP-ribose pyrophosphatase
MSELPPTQEWKLLKTEPGPDLTLFRARYDWMENPRNGEVVKATVLEAPDWVNVVALTPEGKLVVVRQYRFGLGKMTTEIPAGIVEKGEESQMAAARELVEETGYTSTDWEYLGWSAPNPAFLENRCHHWLARGAVQTCSPELDLGEDLAAAEISLEGLREEIKGGRFRHSLAFSALARVYDLRDVLR